jgi:hypothetical protein
MPGYPISDNTNPNAKVSFSTKKKINMNACAVIVPYSLTKTPVQTEDTTR